MFTRYRSLALALLLLPALGASADKPGEPATVSGKLRRIGVTDQEITVASSPEKGGKEIYTTIRVPETAKIMRGDKAIKLEDLKDEESVTVRVEKKEGKNVAMSIQVAGEPGVKAAPAPMPNANANRPVLRKVRKLLQIADKVLEEVEQRRDSKP